MSAELPPAGTAPARARWAIVSAITDNVIGLGATFVASLREKVPPRPHTDFVLLTSKTAGVLSDENRALIRRIYPEVIFREVAEDFLTEDNTRLDKFTQPVTVATRQAPFLKFNLLNFHEYERVLWLDSDTLVLHDFSEVFRLPGDLQMVRTGPAIREAHIGVSVEMRRRFNSGFMVLGPKILQGGYFKAALDLLANRSNFILRDQPLLNQLFIDRRKLYLPHAYNWKLSGDASGWTDDDLASRCAKIVHFVGSTKWHLADPASPLPLARRFHALRESHGIPLVLNP